ncbi:hypothetical protein B0H17DRAFT_1108724 [Mycena rosella]|uniref:Uncharacterized protein n=1 Tax=Mycena rosella TaxID=1033263 RepID=A0AAD7FPV5_MYCRO|nr:hypothetical protein B0H17DRAFT_1108724 [Mycena rosella]
MALRVRRQTSVSLCSLSACSIISRVAPSTIPVFLGGPRSARRIRCHWLFHRARRSSTWRALSSTLRTRSSPTPCSVLPVSFALHTAPPHALLSCFPALIAPSSGHRRMGHQVPRCPHQSSKNSSRSSPISYTCSAMPDVRALRRNRISTSFRAKMTPTLRSAHASSALSPPMPPVPLFPAYLCRHTPRRWSSMGTSRTTAQGSHFAPGRAPCRLRCLQDTRYPVLRPRASSYIRTRARPRRGSGAYLKHQTSASCGLRAAEDGRAVPRAPTTQTARKRASHTRTPAARPAYMHACGVHTRSPSLGCFTGVDEAGEDGGGTIILDEMPTALRGDRNINRERDQRTLQSLVLKLLTVCARILLK